MKTFKYIFISIALLLVSCEKEPIHLYDLSISANDISLIKLRADHKTLLPNGISEMEFYAEAYALKNVTHYLKDADGNFITEKSDTLFLVPSSAIPNGVIKIYDSAGNELVNNRFSTTTHSPGTELEFYAKSGDVVSNRVMITIREVPDESYEEIVIPVIFHVLQPPATAAPSYDLTSEFLEKQLKHASDIFNREITTDPNAGNAKVVFKLAQFGLNGAALQQPGLNLVNLSVADNNALGTSGNKTAQYEKYILDKKRSIIWDPAKYLNIWIARFQTSYTPTGANTAQTYLPPSLIHPDYASETIAGLKLTESEGLPIDSIKDCKQVGIMVNLRGLTMPSSVQGSGNDYTLAYSLGLYYGLLETNARRYSVLVNGDNDYCDDTYSCYFNTYPRILKANGLEGQPEGREVECFTSYNVMDLYSKKNSITVDQAKRLREVLLKCPDRWTYKSNWALTGKD